MRRLTAAKETHPAAAAGNSGPDGKYRKQALIHSARGDEFCT